jgi:hypothetical protein
MAKWITERQAAALSGLTVGRIGNARRAGRFKAKREQYCPVMIELKSFQHWMRTKQPGRPKK